MRNRIILLLFIMLAVIPTVLSQSNGSVTINISLHPIQILKINPAQTELSISFENEDDYQQGVMNYQEKHLTVFSTSGYEVSVYADSPSGSDISGQEQPPSPLHIGVLLPHTSTGGISMSNIQLQQFKQNIISSNRQDVGISFDIEYQGMGDNIYLGHLQHNNNLETVVLRTKLTYSLEVR